MTIAKTAFVLIGAGLCAAAAPALAAEAPGRTEMADDGPVLVNTSGRALYFYGTDDSTPGKSACSTKPVDSIPDPSAGFGKYMLPGYRFARSCAQVWPPYLAPAGAQASGDWGLIDRAEGGKQWTFQGKPVYMSARDLKPGDHNGAFSSEFSRRGWRLAAPPSDFPPGMAFTRIGHELVLTADGKPVYAPRGARMQRASLGVGDAFKPIAASFITNPAKDWSFAEPSPGVRQFTYKGMSLYSAPPNLSSEAILKGGDWQMVVYRKLAPPPAAIRTQFTLAGDLFATRSGMTLYTFTCTAGGSTGCEMPGGGAGFWSALCGDAAECSRRWRPYLAEPGAKPSGEWSVVEVADPIFSDPAGVTYGAELPRVKAWAYRGRPVYTFHGDKEPGDLWGDTTRWFSISAFMAIRVPGKALRE